MAPHERGDFGLQVPLIAVVGGGRRFDGAVTALHERAQRVPDVAHLAFGHLDDAAGVSQPGAGPVVGPGHFQVTASADLPRGLAAVEKRRLRERRAIVADIAQTLWRAAGRVGDPPARLATTVSAHLSSYFTAAVKIDVGDRWQTAGELACDAILAALVRQRPGGSR